MIEIKHWLLEANLPSAMLNPRQTMSDEREVAEIGVDGDTGNQGRRKSSGATTFIGVNGVLRMDWKVGGFNRPWSVCH